MADTTKLTIEIESLLKGLNKTLQGLAAIRKSLESVANVKLNQQSATATNRAALAAQKLALQQQRLITQSQELANRQEKARQSTERLAQSQQRLAQAEERAARASQRGPRLDAHVREFRVREEAARRSAREVARINAQTVRQAEQQSRIQERAATTLANVQTREARRGADALADSLGRNTHILELAQQRLNNLGAAALRVGGGLRSLGLTASVVLTAPLTALATLATRNAVEFDSLRRGLEVMAGSAQEAGQQLARLTEIAKLPGIGFQEAIQGSIRLQAVGFSALDAEKALTQFANAVALTGGGREELSRITVQLGQLAAKGKVVAQDLKPIIEAGPAVGQALLQAFGTVNSEDIQKLGLSSQEFFNRLIDALAKLPRAAAGARNAFENFTDAIFRASLALGDAILPPLTKLINFLEPLVTQLAATFRTLPEGIQVAVIAVGAFAAAIGPVLFIVGGLVSGLGALATALATVLPLLGSIGLPAIAVILAGVGLQITAITATIVTLGIAWRQNFLGIRNLVTDAANAITAAFNRIRTIIDDAVRRVLPTLQSISVKVLGAASAAWETYGKTVVDVVGRAFRFVSDVVETFVRVFSNVIDLILKLVDQDWRGAWRAFARIIVDAVDSTFRLLDRLNQVVGRALRALIAFILIQAVKFVDAATELGRRFIVALGVEILTGFPTIRDALTSMLLLAVANINVGSIATALLGRLFAALRKAASEGLPAAALSLDTTNAAADVSGGAGIFRRKGRTSPKPTGDTGSKGASALARQADKLRDAQDKFAEQEAQNRLDLARVGIEQQFDLTKDGLARELRALEANYDDRLGTVRAYFVKRQQLQEAAIDAELTKERGLSGGLADEFSARAKIIEREFQSARQTALEDPKLKGRARDLALQTAEQERQTALSKAQNDFETQNAAISTRILTLQKQRVDIGTEIARQLKEATREITRQQDALQFDLLEEQGRSADAEAGRLKDRFRETLRDLRVDVTSLGTDLQDALNSTDLSVLQARLDELPEPVRVLISLLDIGIKRAQIAEQQRLVDDLSTGLQLDAARIQNRVLDGLLSQRDAQAEIVALQQQYKSLLLDILQGELAKAQAIGDQSQALAIQGQILETERLGKAIDEVGIQINQTLFRDIEDGFANIFSSARQGFEGLADAAKQLAFSILDTFNQLAAKGLAEKLFGDLLNPNAENTQGTAGGFFSKLFGLAPKAAQTTGAATGAASLQAAGTATATALTTAGTTAGTAMATGGTTAGAALVASLTASAAAFASAVIAAGAAFAASVAAGSATQAIGGLGSSFAGADTGMFPAIPGGAIRVLEGGYPEAILTTDPRHAVEQVKILHDFLAYTKGLSGRIPGFAMGGMVSRASLESDLLGSIQRSPSPFGAFPDIALAGVGRSGDVTIRNVFVDERSIPDWIHSADGNRVLVQWASKNRPTLCKLLGVRDR